MQQPEINSQEMSEPSVDSSFQAAAPSNTPEPSVEQVPANRNNVIMTGVFCGIMCNSFDCESCDCKGFDSSANCNYCVDFFGLGEVCTECTVDPIRCVACDGCLCAESDQSGNVKYFFGC